MSAKAPILVLGVGNSLLGDDAAGLFLLSALSRDGDAWGREVEFLDGGTQGLALLDCIAGRRALLVLDAVKLGAAPGAVHVLREWRRPPARSSTAHESNVSELLEASTLLGECPEQVVIVGIEPCRIATGMELSPPVAQALPGAAEATREVLAELYGHVAQALMPALMPAASRLIGTPAACTKARPEGLGVPSEPGRVKLRATSVAQAH